MFVLDFLHPEFSMLVQTLCHIDLALSAFGKFSFGESSISVLGRVMFDPSLLVHSFVHLGSALPVFDFIRLGLCFSLKNSNRLASSVFASGSLCLGLISLALDYAIVELFVSLQFMSRLSLALFVLDFLHLGFALLLRAFGKLGSSLLPCGCSCLSSSPSVCDYTSTGLNPSLRSFLYLGFALSTSDSASFSSTLLLQQFGALESVLSVLAICRIGLLLLLPDMAASGFSIPLHSFFRPGSSPFPIDTVKSGFPLLARGLAHMDLAALPLGCYRPEPPSLAS